MDKVNREILPVKIKLNRYIAEVTLDNLATGNVPLRPACLNEPGDPQDLKAVQDAALRVRERGNLILAATSCQIIDLRNPRSVKSYRGISLFSAKETRLNKKLGDKLAFKRAVKLFIRSNGWEDAASLGLIPMPNARHGVEKPAGEATTTKTRDDQANPEIILSQENMSFLIGELLSKFLAHPDINKTVLAKRDCPGCPGLESRKESSGHEQSELSSKDSQTWRQESSRRKDSQ